MHGPVTVAPLATCVNSHYTPFVQIPPTRGHLHLRSCAPDARTQDSQEMEEPSSTRTSSVSRRPQSGQTHSMCLACGGPEPERCSGIRHTHTEEKQMKKLGDTSRPLPPPP